MGRRLASLFGVFLLLGASAISPMVPAVGAAAPSGGAAADRSKMTVEAACAPAEPGYAQCYALRRTDIAARAAAGVTPMVVPDGFGPADLQSAYALPGSTAGAGMTVAIVDAYDLPTAEADLATYRTQYGLPACTVANGCFRKVDQNGGTSYPAVNTGWDGEISLDIDMVSAACPSCNILLVEATTSSMANLGTAVNTAVSLGAVAVSNSYGGPESTNASTYDAAYFNHPGVAITASTGDCAYHCAGNYDNVSYPSASPYVVAVGGTTLVKDTSARGWTESAWGNAGDYSGAGSGCSSYESKPSWQTDPSCANRMQADVSAVADPYTGVAVYSTADSGWVVYGGTSASSPIIASVFAMANHPAPSAYPASYLYADTSDLYDAIGGSNNVWGDCVITYYCTGVAGYDGPTGHGTPNGTAAFGPPSAASLTVAGLPSPTVAGVAHDVTVTAKDGHGDTAASYLGTVHFTSTDTAAVLPSDYTFIPGDAGTHTFSVTLKTVGTRSVTATDTLTPSITGTQSGIVINPAAATTMVVAGLTTPRTAGVAGTITVTAKDAYGNTATGYAGTVHFTSTDGAAVLPANATLTAGVGTFSATLKTVGTLSVTATDTVTASIHGSQTGIVVIAAALSKFVVSGMTTPRTAGTAGNIRVTATDTYGNRSTGYLGTVHFTSTDIQAGLPANYTFVAADAGTHVFAGNVILKTAGTQSVTATDTVTASLHGSQTGIVVTAAALSKLVVSGMTTPRTAGSTGSIRVTATDTYGNRVQSYLGTVHFTSTDTQAGLPANYKFTVADAGTHVFSGNVILKTVGTQSVTATDTVTATIHGSQSGIVVTPAALSKLVVSGLTSPRTHGVAGSIRVTATDAYGNRIVGYLGTIHFTSTDSKASLPANYTFLVADAGTHVFSGNVTLKTIGTWSVTATDTVTATLKGSQTGIVVN